mmetsp:Transcript_91240/g.285395  ORF Transcript_91240/g.285395 Transcript_91240/m.285395 type:complete len:200 (-) Transcript_91240:645-1244(-)
MHACTTCVPHACIVPVCGCVSRGRISSLEDTIALALQWLQEVPKVPAQVVKSLQPVHLDWAHPLIEFLPAAHRRHTPLLAEPVDVIQSVFCTGPLPPEDLHLHPEEAYVNVAPEVVADQMRKDLSVQGIVWEPIAAADGGVCLLLVHAADEQGEGKPVSACLCLERQDLRLGLRLPQEGPDHGHSLDGLLLAHVHEVSA